MIYTVRDEAGRFMTDDRNRRFAERAARDAVKARPGVYAVTVGDRIVSLAAKDAATGRIRVTRVDA